MLFFNIRLLHSLCLRSKQVFFLPKLACILEISHWRTKIHQDILIWDMSGELQEVVRHRITLNFLQSHCCLLL